MLIEVYILYRASGLIPSIQRACRGWAQHAAPLQMKKSALSFGNRDVAVGVTVVGDPQDSGQGLARVGFFCAGNEFGRTLGDDAASPFAAFGAKVDDPVGLFDDVEMMLDDEDGVAERDEALEDIEEFAHVVKVETGGGLVEDVESAAGLALGQFACEFDALGFAA